MASVDDMTIVNDLMFKVSILHCLFQMVTKSAANGPSETNHDFGILAIVSEFFKSLEDCCINEKDLALKSSLAFLLISSSVKGLLDYSIHSCQSNLC